MHRLRFRLFLLLIAGLLARPLSFAQDRGDCKKLLLGYVETMNRLQQHTGKKPYFLHLTVTSVPAKGSPYRQTSLSDQDIEVKVFATPGRFVYESTYLTIYQSEEENYTVIHPGKLIVKRDGQRNLENGSKVLDQHLLVLKQQLLTLSTVKHCQSVMLAGRPVQEIELLPNQQAQDLFHIRRMVYYYDPQQQAVARQVIEYVPGYRYEKQDITFHRIEPGYRGTLPAAVAGFLATRKPALEQYKGYTLQNE